MNDETNNQGLGADQAASGAQPDAGAVQPAIEVQPSTGTVQPATEMQPGAVQPTVTILPQAGTQAAPEVQTAQTAQPSVEAQPTSAYQQAYQAAPSVAPAADAGTATAAPVAGVATAAPVADANAAAAGTGGPIPVPGTPAPGTPTPVPGAPAPMPGAPQPSPTAALVCGILAIVLCFLPIVGIGLGIAAIILAGKYFRAGGTQGSGKAGRICGIVGIVLSVILMIINFMIVFGSLSVLSNYERQLDAAISSAAISNSSSSSSSFASSDEEEEALTKVAEDKLKKIADKDPETMKQIADVVADSFDEMGSFTSEDVTLEKLGLDPMVIAEKLVEGFEYEWSDSYVFSSGDEGYADFDIIAHRDVYDISYDYIDLLEDVDVSSFASEDEAYKEMGKLLLQAIDNVDMEDSYLSLDLEKKDGTWTISDDEWEDFLDLYFSFY